MHHHRFITMCQITMMSLTPTPAVYTMTSSIPPPSDYIVYMFPPTHYVYVTHSLSLSLSLLFFYLFIFIRSDFISLWAGRVCLHCNICGYRERGGSHSTCYCCIICHYFLSLLLPLFPFATHTMNVKMLVE